MSTWIRKVAKKKEIEGQIWRKTWEKKVTGLIANEMWWKKK